MNNLSANFTSILTAITSQQYGPSGTRAREALSRLTTAAPRPRDSAGIGRACRGSLVAVRAVIAAIKTPNAALLEIEEQSCALDKLISDALESSATQELKAPVVNRNSAYPQWSALCALAEPGMHTAASIAGGVELLRAWKDNRVISKAATHDISKAQLDEPLTANEIRQLLLGAVADDDITSAWQKRLQRSWRQVLLHFCDAGYTQPVQSFEDQASGQILETTMYASPTRRAGAADHRQLSTLQLKSVVEAIGRWIEQDDFQGTYALMVCSTGLSIDLIPRIPLQSATTPDGWVAVLDVNSGCLKMDLSTLAREASRASVASTLMSSYICIKALPKQLAEQLRARFAKTPQAKCLCELYPEAVPIKTDSAVIRCFDEIAPSWARLRRSSGTYMRQLGIDNLLAPR